MQLGNTCVRILSKKPETAEEWVPVLCAITS